MRVVAFMTKDEHNSNARIVFVVHGRNPVARDALFEFLRAIDLHPLEWSEAVRATGGASPYIAEILDTAFSRAQAVVVLLTPDDDARLRQQLWEASESPHETFFGDKRGQMYCLRRVWRWDAMSDARC